MTGGAPGGPAPARPLRLAVTASVVSAETVEFVQEAERLGADAA